MTNESLPMTIINSTFDTNVALYQSSQGVGGAIYADYGAPVTIDGCHFENNEARWRLKSKVRFPSTASSVLQISTRTRAVLLQSSTNSIRLNDFRS